MSHYFCRRTLMLTRDRLHLIIHTGRTMVARSLTQEVRSSPLNPLIYIYMTRHIYIISWLLSLLLNFGWTLHCDTGVDSMHSRALIYLVCCNTMEISTNRRALTCNWFQIPHRICARWCKPELQLCRPKQSLFGCWYGNLGQCYGRLQLLAFCIRSNWVRCVCSIRSVTSVIIGYIVSSEN